MTALTLWREDAERNMHRFYKVDVQPDLFGSWCFIRAWGRIGTDGQTRSVAYPTADEAQKMLSRHRRAKEKEGYTTQAPPPPSIAVCNAAVSAKAAKRKRKADDADGPFNLTAGIEAIKR